MIKKLILPLLLSFGMVSSLAMNPVTVHAEEEKDSGIVTSKTVAYDEEDGSYTITLEAYATGEVTTSTVTKEVPTDIILVLDLSSSMNQNIGTVSYREYSNENNEALYALRHNGGKGNLWYKDGDSYYSVSVTAEGREPTYTDTDASGSTNSTLYNDRSNLYARIGEDYVKVKVSREGWWNYTYTYTYTYTYDGKDITVTSSGDKGKPQFDSGVSLCVLRGVDSTNATYTYSYTDSKGEEKKIVTSNGGTTVPRDVTFYSRSTSSSGGGTRLAALKTACTNFAEAVAAKCKTETGGTVDHRIAVVGFNSGSTRYTGTSDDDALIDMSGTDAATTVESAIDKLTTGQGTVPETGLKKANDIFEANRIPEGETRNRVVVFFTDGYPSTSGADNFNDTLANKAITQANTAKNTHGATVYSVAVLAGADPTSAGKEDGTNSEKVNWYLHNVSSNKDGKPQTPSYYLSAGDADSLNNIFQQISEQIDTGGSTSKLAGDAVVRDIVSPYFMLPSGATAANITLESYSYKGNSLTAADAWEKNGTALGAAASIDTVKDETTGVEQNRVNVTGFNFSENWCGTESQTGTVGAVTYRGNKLVISFKVTPRVGFLGGNNVPTNGKDSGVYENVDAKTAVEEFTVPKANVTIKDVTTIAEDKNVYLLGSVTKEELQNGATVMVGAGAEGEGGIALDLSKATDEDKPYGLEKWQSEYVDIKVTIKDKDGTDIPATGLQNLKEDSEYSIEVKIAPKETADTDSVGPNVEARTGEDTADINVFKPQLTFKDGNAYYGETVATDFSGNKVGVEKWMHDTTEAVPADMIGTAPTLDISYAPDAGKIENSKYTKQDVPVATTVKIDTVDVTADTAFVHTPCQEGSGYTWTDPTAPGDPAFLIHIKTCTLTVTKEGDNSTLDNGSYVFTVRKDGQPYSEVSIQGNDSQTLCELPVGTYSIEENTGWSWRYSASPDYSVDAVLSSQKPAGTISCTNTREKGNWLDGYSAIVRNVFGIGSSSAAGSDTQ